MLWLRRISAVILSVFFVGVFGAVTVVSSVTGAALSPEFYADKLRQADAYNFFYDGILPYALDQALEETEDPVVEPEALKKESVEAVRKVLPPEWLQERVEEALFQLLPYVSGQTDRFALTLDINDRVPLAAEEAKRLLDGSVTLDTLYLEVTSRFADEVAGQQGEMPAGVRLEKEDVLQAVRSVAPKAWVARQMGLAIDELAPWAQGKEEHFTIRVVLADRVEVAGQELKRLLRKSDATALVRQELLDPLVDETVGPLTALPYGIQVSRDEVRGVLRQVLPDSWVQARLEGLVDAVVAYLTGKTATFSLAVPLSDRREAAYQAIAQLADRKLESAYNGLPQCSEQEFARAVAGLPSGQLPRCRPAGAGYPEAKRLLGIDLEGAVRQRFAGQLPDAWTFQQEDLRAMLGQESWDNVQKLRRWVTEGYVYTDADLRARLGSENEASLDRVLRFVWEGGAFTDEDLREQLAEGANGEESLEDLDQARSLLRTVRRTAWLNWLVAAVVLIAVGAIGGSTRGSRLAWAGGALAVAAAAWLVGALVLSGVLIEPQVWVDRAMETRDPEMRPIVEWAVGLGESVASGIAKGIQLRCLLALVVGVTGLALGIWLHSRSRRTVVAEVVGPERR